MKLIKKELVQIQNDYNNRNLYQQFEKDTGIQLEFEPNQYYGTCCYGIINFSTNYKGAYPTLKELEEKFNKHRTKSLGKYDKINIHDIVNYYRRLGVLPEIDFLF